MRILLTFIIAFSSIIGWSQSTGILKVTNGKIDFISEAPDEIIKASTEKVVGLLDPQKMTFAFSVPVSSFMGFNSELQREHFNENYMESNKYPKAIFKGKLGDEVNFFSDGSYSVEAKGTFTIHGVEITKDVQVIISIKGDEVIASSNFDILLSDHDIDIPTVVKTKLSNKIKVNVEAVFQPKS